MKSKEDGSVHKGLHDVSSRMPSESMEIQQTNTPKFVNIDRSRQTIRDQLADELQTTASRVGLSSTDKNFDFSRRNVSAWESIKLGV